MLNLDGIKSVAVQTKTLSRKDIAIIGISVRIPQADTLDDLWRILINKEDVVGLLPEARKNDVFRYMSYIQQKAAIQHCGYLDRIDEFDYKFFKLSYKEACAMDPRQRIFLETAWHAIEDAGYNRETIKGTKTGVYVGMSALGEYSYLDMYKNIFPEALSQSVQGNLVAMLPSRLSYIFDLHGPSMVVDTACSSSMVALIQACQSLRQGINDMALVGGVRVYPYPVESGLRLGTESSDGKTRTFDERADGTGIAEAAVSVMIKPLSHAIRDNDPVHAVIKGYASNQDGKSLWMSAPNREAQVNVITSAWRDAEVDPNDIAYLEAHGTGTTLGDPIEVDAITRAFAPITDRKQFCGIGSIKSNMGHSYDVSGLVSVAKTVLILKHGMIPPTAHFHVPNTHIDFCNSPVYVVDSCRAMPKDGEGLCGISSFGFSGTNSHIILSSHKQSAKEQSTDDKDLIFVLSARSLSSLQRQLQKYYRFSRTTKECLRDVCYTTVLREVFPYRLAFYVRSWPELCRKIQDLLMDFEQCKHTQGYYFSENMLADLIEQPTQPDSLCSQFVQGVAVDWLNVFDKNCKKVHLPANCFEKEICWLEIPIRDHMIESN